VLTVQRSAGSSVSTANWAEALKSYLRHDDFIGVAGKNTVAVVSYGISEEGAEKLARRFQQALRLTGNSDTPMPRIAWYPQQASRADELLDPWTRDLQELVASSH
jgi:GGDEF domain-containing protein